MRGHRATVAFGTLLRSYPLDEMFLAAVGLANELGVPIGLGVSYAKDLATGTHAFVGKMAAEMEMRDAETGELIWKKTIHGGWVWGSAAVPASCRRVALPMR